MKTLLISLWNNPATVRKFIVALIGAVLVGINIGLFPAALGGWMPVIISFATSLGVYRVYNEKDGDTHV